MRIGFIVFDGMTALDFVGVFDPLTRLKTMGFLPDIAWDICGLSKRVFDSTGLVFEPNKVANELNIYNIVIIPGGFSTRRLVSDEDFIDWIKGAEKCPLKASVCTGALIWGAAGFLFGKAATTHPSAYQDLAKYCLNVSQERIVDSGDIITAGGVTAGIDLGLYLCKKIAGTEAKDKIRKQMDYFHL